MIKNKIIFFFIILILNSISLKSTDIIEVIYVDLYINNVKIDGIFPIIQDGENIWFHSAEWEKLSLKKLSDIKTKEFQNETYYLLDSRFKNNLNKLELSLNLEIPTKLMKVNLITEQKKIVKQSDSLFSFYWNYHFSFAHEPIAYTKSLNAYHKFILTTPKGFLSNTLLTTFIPNGKIIRLDSSYVIDFSSKKLRLTMGDSISDSPYWSSSLSLAGLKLQKGFFFNDNILTYPTLNLFGAIERDGNIEIKINDTSKFKNTIPMGNFQLNNPNLPSGSNKGEIIIKDSQGFIRAIPFFYYADSELLRPGFNTFSYSTGWLRKNYGETSFQYDKFAGFLNHKIGLTNFWTISLHSQLSKKHFVYGNEQRFRLFNFASLAFSSGLSSKKKEIGYVLGGEFNIQKYNVEFRNKLTYYSSKFQPLMVANNVDKKYSYTLLSSFKFNYGVFKNTFFNYFFTKEKYSYQSILGITQNFTWSNVQLSFNAEYGFHDKNINLFALLYFPFKQRQSVSLQLKKQKDQLQSNINYNFKSDDKSIHKYSVNSNVAFSENIKNKNSFSYDNPYFKSNLLLNFDKNFLSYNTQLSSCIGIIKNKLFISKPIENSVAIVHIPNAYGVKVFQGHTNFIGKTDKNGYLILPDLTSYNENLISFETNSLDTSVQTDEIENDVIINTGFNTAHEISINAKKIKRVVFKLLQNNQPLPSGTKILFENEKFDSYVGKNGEVYVEILTTNNSLNGYDVDKSCLFELELPKKSSEIIEELGIIYCKNN